MGTRPRLTLLMLTALFAVMNPPGRPPGDTPPKPAPMIRCNYKNCRGMGELQRGCRYVCDEHGHTFYYCINHRRYLAPEEAAEHRDEQVAEHQDETA
jgi:hypothetical protein